MKFVVKDNKDRIILSVDEEGRMAASRFPDMEEEYKDYLVEMCKELTDDDPKEFRKFLDFEDDDEFCA